MQQITEFLSHIQSFPAWYRVLFAVWIAILAVLVIGYSALQGQSSKQATNSAKPASSEQVLAAALEPIVKTVNAHVQAAVFGPVTDQAAPAEQIGMTLQEYWSKWSELEGRFLLVEQHIESIRGKRIDWCGLVRNVSSTHSSDHGVSITVEAWAEQIGALGTAYLRVPESLRVAAFALRVGDRVQFTGIVESLMAPVPRVRVQELVVVAHGPLGERRLGGLELQPKVEDRRAT